VSHGGSWNFDATLCKSANRDFNYPRGTRSGNRGFRVVLVEFAEANEEAAGVLEELKQELATATCRG
jgi:hypothetical protein